MKWSLSDPRFGDIVRVKTGDFYHYGIYASDDEIIQFGNTPVDRRMLVAKDIKVCVSSVSDFLAGGFMETGQPELLERKKMKTPEETVAAARGFIGSGGYHLLNNNCEHFAYFCKFGEKKCSQIDEVREKVAKLLDK